MAYITIQKIIESGLSRTEFIDLLNDERKDPNSFLLYEDEVLDPEPDPVPVYDDTHPVIVRANGKILKGDTLIDAHLRGRYELPLETVPQMIADLSLDFAIHYCWEHRHRVSMPEDLIIKMKDNLKLLAGIQKGDINPGIEPVDKRANTIIKTDKTASNKTFTDDFMKDF